MKVREKNEARVLRKQGLPLKDISEQLGVAKSSVSLWVRDIKLTEEHLLSLQGRARLCGSKKWITDNRNERLRNQQIGWNRIISGDKDFAIGCMLYWAEGSKKRNVLKISNCDPDFIKFFKTWLINAFAIPSELFCIYISVHLGNGLTTNQVEQFWLHYLSLSHSNMRKTSVVYKHIMSKGLKKNKHPHGVCHLVVNSTKYVQQIYGGIQACIGLPAGTRWLD